MTDKPDLITVSVSTPEGVIAPKVTLWFHPETVEEFDAVVDAAGGVLGFQTVSDFVSAGIAPGVDVFVYQPPCTKPQPQPVNEFMDKFRERADGAREFLAKLEAGKAAA